MRIHQEDSVLLDSLVDLCTDAALQDELESLEVGRVHLNDGSHVTCLLLHGLYGDLKRCGEEQFSSHVYRPKYIVGSMADHLPQ